MNPFRVSVEDAFRRILGRGYRVSSDTYEPDVFGNGMVVLENGSVRIRVVRDRGQVFVDVASRSSPNDWHPLQRALRAAGVQTSPEEGPIELQMAGGLIEQELSQLQQAFGPQQYPATEKVLRRLGDAAGQRFVDRVNRLRRT